MLHCIIEIVFNTQESLLKAGIDARLASKLPKMPMLKPRIAVTGFVGKFGVKSVVDASFLYRFHCVMHSLYAVIKHLELSNCLQ